MVTRIEQRSRTHGDSRPRKTDITPDSQRAKARERGPSKTTARERGPSKTTADYMDEEREIGRQQGHEEGYRAAQNEPKAKKAAPAKAAPSPRSSSTPAPAPRRSLQVQAPGAVPSIAAPMLVELAIISADEFVNQHRPPLPSRLLSAFAIFGLLGLAKGNAAKPAQVFGWAIVLATFYSAAPGKKPAGISFLTTAGNFFSGKYGKQPSTLAPSTTTKGA